MSKTKVVSIINFKGGVGKSTVTFNLGYELSIRDKKVLMIDFDGQGNLTAFCGADKNYSIDENIVSALNRITDGEGINLSGIYRVYKNLDIIPCNIQKENWSSKALSVIARETLLKRFIDYIRATARYDYILIDNSPSVGLDFQNSLVASDEYMIVTEPESASTDGIKTIYSIICEIKQYLNNALKSTGIVINKVDDRTNLHKTMKEVIKEVWGGIHVFDTCIPKSINIGESEFLGLPIKLYNCDSKVSVAFGNLCNEFLKKTEG